MKTSKLFWGLGFLLAAVLIILDVVGVMPTLLSAVGEVSVFSLILGLLLLSYAIARLCRGRIAEIFLPLALIFMLFEKNMAFLCGFESKNFINNWLVLLIAVLLAIGFEILLPHNRKRKKHIKVVASESNNTLKSASVYIDCTSFSSNNIVVNKLGECTVHFQNVDEYQGGQTLTVSNSLGAMTVNVPSSWTLNVDIDNTMGDVEAPPHRDNGGPVLYIKGDNHLGALEINFV